MRHSPHQIAQAGQAALKPRLLGTQTRLEFALSVLRAIPGDSQKSNRLRAFPPALARMPLGKSTRFNEFRLRRFQFQSKLPQSLAQSPHRRGLCHSKQYLIPCEISGLLYTNLTGSKCFAYFGTEGRLLVKSSIAALRQTSLNHPLATKSNRAPSAKRTHSR